MRCLLLSQEQIRTPWHEFWRRFRRQRMALCAGLFVLVLIMVAIFARWLTPFDAENYFDYDRLNDGPSMLHWFGVDSLGRDIFSRVLVGAQISLAAGVFAVLIGAAIGTVLGLLAGYYAGWWDPTDYAHLRCTVRLSGDFAGDCCGGGAGKRYGQRDYCRGYLFHSGLRAPGAREYASAEAADLY